MTKILVLGDTHANWILTRRVLDSALTADIDTIFQVGDFGYWPHMSDWHISLGKFLDKRNVTLHFADGNHEDHLSLNALHDESGDADSVVLDPNTGRVRHWKRGAITHFGDSSVMFFGGAASVDRLNRTPGLDWFPEELPTFKDYENAMTNIDLLGRPDFVVAHDTPSFAPPQYDRHQQAYWPAEDIRTSKAVRTTMANLCEVAVPKVWFAGHHHRRIQETIGETTFQILSCDGTMFHHWAQPFDLDELRKK